jgi:hypothetical protein
MDVGLSVLWRLNLDNEVDTRDVQTTGSDVSGDEYAELFVLESLESDFTLILCDVTMHDLDILLNLL